MLASDRLCRANETRAIEHIDGIGEVEAMLFYVAQTFVRAHSISSNCMLVPWYAGGGDHTRCIRKIAHLLLSLPVSCLAL